MFIVLGVAAYHSRENHLLQVGTLLTYIALVTFIGRMRDIRTIGRKMLILNHDFNYLNFKP